MNEQIISAATSETCEQCGHVGSFHTTHHCPICERKLCRKCRGRKWCPIGGRGIYEVCNRCEAVGAEFRKQLVALKRAVERTVAQWSKKSANP